MKNIGKNENLINRLSENLSLTSCKISRINIYSQDDDLFIEVYLKLIYFESEDQLKLKFSQIEEYSFIYNSDYSFYNVETYKFFTIQNSFYISFDPEDEEEIIADSDQDYILCKHVEGFFVSKTEVFAD